jgi:hypothetical protein
MKILYVIFGYLLGIASVYIAGIASENYFTQSFGVDGIVSFSYHPLALVFFIPALFLFGIAIFSISKAIDV